MALTNLSATSFVRTLPNGQGADDLFRLAVGGDQNAAIKLASGEQGFDYVWTGNTAGAETVNFTVPFASLLKLYSAQVSGVTRLVLKARISARSAAVATSDYWEKYDVFDDISGTMTSQLAAGAVVAIEGAATTDPVMTNSGSNTLQIAVTTLAAAAVRIELSVYHVQ